MYHIFPMAYLISRSFYYYSNCTLSLFMSYHSSLCQIGLLYLLLIGLAFLTLNVLPRNSASSILSIALKASSTSSYSINANPLCFYFYVGSSTVYGSNISL